MSYIITAAIAIISAVFAYIQYLLRQKKSLEDRVAQAQTKDTMNKDLQDIAKEATHVTEKERDYSDLRDEYIKQHPDDKG